MGGFELNSISFSNTKLVNGTTGEIGFVNNPMLFEQDHDPAVKKRNQQLFDLHIESYYKELFSIMENENPEKGDYKLIGYRNGKPNRWVRKTDKGNEFIEYDINNPDVLKYRGGRSRGLKNDKEIEIMFYPNSNIPKSGTLTEYNEMYDTYTVYHFDYTADGKKILRQKSTIFNNYDEYQNNDGYVH